LAEKNSALAVRQKNLAVVENNETRRLRMISIGKSMSLKSSQMADKKNLPDPSGFIRPTCLLKGITDPIMMQIFMPVCITLPPAMAVLN